MVYEYVVNPDDSISLSLSEGGDNVEIAELECGEPTGGSVLGQEQQVNHGMFLRLFNQM